LLGLVHFVNQNRSTCFCAYYLYNEGLADFKFKESALEFRDGISMVSKAVWFLELLILAHDMYVGQYLNGRHAS
jgi:hypothetical protein